MDSFVIDTHTQKKKNLWGSPQGLPFLVGHLYQVLPTVTEPRQGNPLNGHKINTFFLLELMDNQDNKHLHEIPLDQLHQQIPVPLGFPGWMQKWCDDWGIQTFKSETFSVQCACSAHYVLLLKFQCNTRWRAPLLTGDPGWPVSPFSHMQVFGCGHWSRGQMLRLVFYET